MKIEKYINVKDMTTLYTLTLNHFELEDIQLNEIQKFIIESLNSTDLISDKLLALSTVVQSIEKRQKALAKSLPKDYSKIRKEKL